MNKLRKIRFVRMTESLTPMAREMLHRLVHEPIRVEQNTEGIEVIRSSTSLSSRVLSEQETEILQAITPDMWLRMCRIRPDLEIEDGWVR